MPNQRAENRQCICPLEYGYHALGGKWKPRILCVLGQSSPRRYTDIRRHIETITDAVLSNTLKELISQGMVKREQFDVIPPHVEYSLTEKGQSALPLVHAFCLWSMQHAAGDFEEKKDAPDCRLGCSFLEKLQGTNPLEAPATGEN